ncbi:unnamed protein product [Acanthosepion pharaonis]|uniref:Uncharacterized protein n=1 Tax=Acanthosepion pharaonis TaxID=158019 RepID=A0A812C0M2_ACAPH|nr:unnamed protein product [Sepia pharaonis]
MTQDPSLFGENLNASLRAALGDNNLSLIANGQLPSGPLDGVEDLSMKSQASHLENLSTEPISEEELLLSIKQEPPCETDNMTTTPSILRPSELPMLGPSASEASLMTSQPSDTAAMMGSNSDTPMLRQNPSDTTLMCSAADVSSSIHSVDTPTMCPATDSSLMCTGNDTSMMGETSDMYPPSEASGTNDTINDHENCAVDFSMVEEPATPPPPDRLESNHGVQTPSELVSHSSDA